MNGIVTWWDGVEQWLTGQPFALQLVAVVAVLIPFFVSLGWAVYALVGVAFSVGDGVAGRFASDAEPALTQVEE